MQSRRDFMLVVAVVVAPGGLAALGRHQPQPRKEQLITVTLLIDGMT